MQCPLPSLNLHLTLPCPVQVIQGNHPNPGSHPAARAAAASPGSQHQPCLPRPGCCCQQPPGQPGSCTAGSAATCHTQQRPAGHAARDDPPGAAQHTLTAQQALRRTHHCRCCLLGSKRTQGSRQLGAGRDAAAAASRRAVGADGTCAVWTLHADLDRCGKRQRDSSTRHSIPQQPPSITLSPQHCLRVCAVTTLLQVGTAWACWRCWCGCRGLGGGSSTAAHAAW